MIPSREWVVVAETRPVAEQTYVLGYDDPVGAARIQPGQFCMISPDTGASGIFLPRPFSYFRVLDSVRVEILFRTLGRGTQWMAGLEPGDRMGVFGPLGRPFEPEPPSGRVVLVGGGIGLPPLVMLAEKLSRLASPPEIDLIYGELCGERVVDLKGILPEEVRLAVCSEDGTVGFHGRVTEYLTRNVLAGLAVPPAVYTCGPTAMMAALAEILEGQDVALFEASLEENMACGHGICMGCAVTLKDEPGRTHYKLCCTEGPVFNGFEVKWR